MSAKTVKSKRPSLPLYVPPSLRKSHNPQSSSSCFKNDTQDSEKPSVEPDSPEHSAIKPCLTSPEFNTSSIASSLRSKEPTECPNIQQNSSVKDVNSSTSFTDLTDSLQQLNLNTSFEDFGLYIVGDQQKEVIKVPAGASTSTYTNPPHLNYDNLQHIIELYGFPADADSLLIEAELGSFNSSGFILKWVDETHCLAVFSSSLVAEQALKSISGVFMKARPVEEASVASKWKIAKSPGDWALPYKKRPPSDASVANLFISTHLGLPRPKPSSQILQARKEAQERRERRRKNQEAIWGDD
ncbi:hypothetical protein Aperf_G00000025495 [Anoplocephala perfoliata]